MEEAKHLLALKVVHSHNSVTLDYQDMGVLRMRMNRSLVSVLLDWTSGLGRLEGWFGLDILDQLVIAGYG